jgi:hypothetical protein
VVGTVLVVALVVLGTAVVVAVGGQALHETERQSDLERAQQAMAQFDSRAAEVVLDDANRRTVRFGRTSGSYRVDPTAGEISIINVDRDGDGVDDDGDDDPTAGPDNDDEYVLPPTTLGAVVYESGDTTIAYQGGGVWQRGPDGTRMVSPPEFHYRGRTLMLPVVQVVGEGAAAGSARATVSRGGFHDRRVYPNASRSFSVAGTDPFLNPVPNGSIVVRIESEYARAWGSYFEERTDGEVTYPADGVVVVDFASVPPDGRLDMPLEGSALAVAGATDHGVERATPGGTAFSVRLRPDDDDGATFSNLRWSLYAEEGDRTLEIHLRKAGGGDGCSDGSTNTAAHLTIYYSWNGGEDYHGWTTEGVGAIPAACADLDPSDPGEEIYLDVTFADDDGDGEYDDDEGSNDVRLEFRALSSGDLERFAAGGTLNGSYAVEGHAAEGEPVSPVTGNPGTVRTADLLVNHYFAELPEEFDLRVDDRGSDTVAEDASSVTLFTSGGRRHVTYLHVTTNQVDVTVDVDD